MRASFAGQVSSPARMTDLVSNSDGGVHEFLSLLFVIVIPLTANMNDTTSFIVDDDRLSRFRMNIACSRCITCCLINCWMCLSVFESLHDLFFCPTSLCH